MKNVVYTCPFVPAEWIAAHGLKPERILPSARAEEYLTGQGVCPFTQAYLNQIASNGHAAAFLFTTTCDQMRRAPEGLPGPSRFVLHVPTTWQTTTAQKLYMNELKRLGRFLETLGGVKPSKDRLVDVMMEYDDTRSRLRASRGLLPPRRFSEAVAAFHRCGTFEELQKGMESISSGVPLALVGSPLLPHLFKLFDLIEQGGGTVVLDATTSGERTLPAPFDRRELKHDPLRTLAEAYFGCIPDAFRRPNSLLYTWLKEELEARGVRGLVFLKYTWCDTWNGEVERMREWCNLPLLAVDTGDETEIKARTQSRIDSFLEVLA